MDVCIWMGCMYGVVCPMYATLRVCVCARSSLVERSAKVLRDRSFMFGASLVIISALYKHWSVQYFYFRQICQKLNCSKQGYLPIKLWLNIKLQYTQVGHSNVLFLKQLQAKPNLCYVGKLRKHHFCEKLYFLVSFSFVSSEF